MKKEKVILIIVGILLSFLLGIVIRDVLSNNNSNDDNEILIVHEFSNFAWTPTLTGKALFSDGSIYSWNLSGNEVKELDYDFNTVDGISEFIKNNASKAKCFVSTKDIKQIKNYISKLDENSTYETRYVGADIGSSYIYVFKNNKKVFLATGGDSSGENDNKYAQKLLKLFDKIC